MIAVSLLYGPSITGGVAVCASAWAGVTNIAARTNNAINGMRLQKPTNGMRLFIQDKSYAKKKGGLCNTARLK